MEKINTLDNYFRFCLNEWEILPPFPFTCIFSNDACIKKKGKFTINDTKCARFQMLKCI